MVGKTDRKAERERRHARVRTKISGTAERPRLCVYRSNKNLFVRVIDDVNGTTLAAASTLDKEVKNKHANSEGKVETVDEHMGAWENYLMELYGQHTSIKTLSDDYVILTWEGETLDNSDFTKISISISYDEGQEERPFVSVDFY